MRCWFGLRFNNDLVRYCDYTDVLTGKKGAVGFYTEEQLAKIKRQLNAMEVIAWASRG